MLVRSSCQLLLFAPPPLPAAITVSLQSCCWLLSLAATHTLLPLHIAAHTLLRCTLLHPCHIRCPLPHARWLPAIHCNCAPVRRCLRLHQCTLLAATPTPPLLHTAACTPLAPLLPSPLPNPPLLMPRPLIAKKKGSINWFYLIAGYYLVGGGGGGGWLAPSATAPPNAHLNPQLPITVIVFHCNFSAIPPSFLPPPPPLLPPIVIVPPAGRCHYCLPLQSCCRPLPPAAAHTLMLLHAVARMPHSLPTAACTLAACRLCDHSPGHRLLLPHTCMLLATAPTPPLLHTAARTPLPPLLLPSLPPLPLLVPRQLIA
jgi:hypothetical protein